MQATRILSKLVENATKGLQHRRLTRLAVLSEITGISPLATSTEIPNGVSETVLNQHCPYWIHHTYNSPYGMFRPLAEKHSGLIVSQLGTRADIQAREHTAALQRKAEKRNQYLARKQAKKQPAMMTEREKARQARFL